MESGSGELQQLPRKAKQNPSSSIKPFAELRNIWIWTRLHSRGKILVDFCLGWALLSVSSLQCSMHTRSPAPWPRFPPLATGAQTLAKVKREAWQWWSRLNPQGGFIHIICTRAGRHAQPKYTTVSAYLEVRAGESLRLQSPTAPRGAGATDQDGVTSAELCGRLA